MSDQAQQVNALLVRQGVNMGDHADTTREAVSVRPDETVGEVLERLLTVEVSDWSGRYSERPVKRRQVRTLAVLELRLVADEPSP